jgi:curved DNA-binding protein CbpA
MLRHSFTIVRHYATTPRTPFQVLSLPSTASTTEIKRRYKELAKTLHPDNPNGDRAKFQELVKAYELLIHPQHKAAYIKTGYGWGNQPSSGVPPGQRPPSYTNAPWAGPVYTTNTTFISLLAGLVVLVGSVNLFYFQSSHSTLLSAADRHHAQTRQNLQRARTEAKLFGNQRGVERVLNHRMRDLRPTNKED